MKKFLLFLSLLLSFGLVGHAQDYELVYNLVPASGSNNSYASNCDITISGITWNLEGNSQESPWRIGGKSLSNPTDRALYSKTAIEDNVAKVEMEIGTMSNITLKSFTFIVSKNSNFSNPVYSQSHAVSASSTITITKPTGQDWSNCYYKFLFNVTVSGSSNRYIQFVGAKFYTEKNTQLQPTIAAPTFAINGTTVSGKATAKVGDTLTMSADEGILYTVDGTIPSTDLEGSEEFYEGDITLSNAGTFTYNAIAYDENDNTSEVSTLTVTITDNSTVEPDPTPGDNVTATVIFKDQDLSYGAQNKTKTWISSDNKYKFVTTASITGSTYPTKNSSTYLRIYNSNGNTIEVNAPENCYFVSVSAALQNAANHVAIDGNEITSNNGTYTFTGENTTSFKLTSVKSNNNNNTDVVSLTFVLVDNSSSTQPKTPVILTFPTSEYTAELTEGFEAPTATPSISAAADFIVYESSNPDVATVNKGSGTIELQGTGFTEITASLSDNDTYSAEPVKYKLTVIDTVGGGDDPVDPTAGTKYVLVNGVQDIDLDAIYTLSSNTTVLGSMASGTKYFGEVANGFELSSDKTEAKAINDFETFKLEKDGNYYYLVFDGKYLSSGTNSSSNNTLVLNLDKSDACKVTLTFNTSTKTVNIKFNQNGTANILQYSSANSRFSNYKSNSGMVDCSLYKKVVEDIPEVPTPDVPTLTVNGEVIDSSLESMTVAPNTKVTINCENAEYLAGFIGDEIELTKEPLPYTFTVTEETLVFVQGFNSNDEPGEELSFTFFVAEVDENMPTVGSRFRQMFNDTELPLTEGYYVIGRHYNGNDNPVHVAMGREFSNGNFNSSTNVEFVDNVPTIRNGNDLVDGNFTVMRMTGDDVLIVKLEKDGENWGMRTVNYGDKTKDSQKYLALGTGTAFALSDEFAPVSIEFTDFKNAKISFSDTEGRLISYNTNGTFNNLKTTSANVQLYRYTVKDVYEPQFEPITLVEGTTTENPIMPTVDVENHPEISYRVKGNTTIIKLEDDNKVTAQERQGSATIIASWADDDNWFAGRAEIPVTVKKNLNDDEFYFRHAVVRGKKDVGVTAQAVYYAGTGKVTYSISREGKEDVSDEIIINAETGMIRPDDLKNPVISTEENEVPYTVTASVSETDDHISAIATYTIIIEDVETAAPEASDATYDFTDTSNPYKLFDDFTSSNTSNGAKYGSSYEHNVNEVEGIEHTPVSEITVNGVTMSLTGSYRWFNNEHLRGYSDFTMTISCPGGFITAIEIDRSSGYLKCDSEGTYSNDKWIAPSGKEVSEVKFSVNSGTPRINKVTVFVEQKSTTSKPEAELSFNDVDRIVNIFAEEETTLPELFHAKDEDFVFDDMSFDIDEVNEADEDESFKNYIIDAKNFDNITVKVNVPGVYTFRAEYKGDKFLKGMAILRLNVFPRLSVQPTSPDADEDGKLTDDERNGRPELTIVTPDEDGRVVIAVPSIDELNDALKYSTVSLSQVEVKHGDDITIYKAGYNTPDVSALATTVTKDLSELQDTNLEFTKDGYVKYTLVYANTPDFFMEETVNVVMTPKAPELIKEGFDENGNAKYKLTQYVDVNGVKYPIQYTFFKYNGSQDPEFEQVYVASNQLSAYAENDAEITWNVAENDVELTVPKGETYAVKYRSVKNILELAPDNGTLGSEENFVALKDGETTGVDNVIADAEDGDVIFYNLQGVRVENPRAGEVYIRVQGKNAEKVHIR